MASNLKQTVERGGGGGGSSVFKTQLIGRSVGLSRHDAGVGGGLLVPQWSVRASGPTVFISGTAIDLTLLISCVPHAIALYPPPPPFRPPTRRFLLKIVLRSMIVIITIIVTIMMSRKSTF